MASLAISAPFPNLPGRHGSMGSRGGVPSCSAFLRSPDGGTDRPEGEHDPHRKLGPTARGAHVYRVSRLAGSGSGERSSRARGVKLRRYFVRSSRGIVLFVVALFLCNSRRCEAYSRSGFIGLRARDVAHRYDRIERHGILALSRALTPCSKSMSRLS